MRKVEGVCSGVVTHPQVDGDGGHVGQVSGQVPWHVREGTANTADGVLYVLRMFRTGQEVM